MYTAEASAIGRKPPSSSRVGIGGNVPSQVFPFYRDMVNERPVSRR